jgi:two-component system cell cycle sensor histidine kinase/response regulator CckA
VSTSASPSILYVDDDENHRHTFTWLLERAGFRTREGRTGADALRLAAEKPDLIILDVNLPDIDGFEVCRRIKGQPATAAIPVLQMSGVYVRSEDRTLGLESGADGYLTKPVEPREVIATVRALLRVRQAEEAARQAAHEWQATFDAIHDALCLLDPSGSVRRCNRAMAELLRQPVDALLGQPFAPRLRGLYGDEAERLLALLDNPPRSGEVQLAERSFRVTVDPVKNEHGAVTGCVVLLNDATERQALAEQLRQAQKMEALGRLAGGIAHDFNNLLTAITGNLALVLARLPTDDPNREMLQVTENAAWSAADLTRQLLGFSRQARLWLKPVHLPACLQESLSILERTLGGGVEIEMVTGPEVWPVQADPSQMNQVLMNLCLNARDAMPGGGRIVVTVQNRVLTPEYARTHLQSRPGEFVELSVRDTGQGIPPQILPRIFDPFFTTKEEGHGTGLGLSTVFGIVQQHQGWIECSSTVGVGTCFRVYLPRYRPSEQDLAPSPSP